MLKGRNEFGSIALPLLEAFAVEFTAGTGLGSRNWAIREQQNWTADGAGVREDGFPYTWWSIHSTPFSASFSLDTTIHQTANNTNAHASAGDFLRFE
jgi:hypothetical protein